jgi:hypothetical protein
MAMILSFVFFVYIRLLSGSLSPTQQPEL